MPHVRAVHRRLPVQAGCFTRVERAMREEMATADRLAAFSDGVIAVIMTIMVLETTGTDSEQKAVHRRTPAERREGGWDEEMLPRRLGELKGRTKSRWSRWSLFRLTILTQNARWSLFPE